MPIVLGNTSISGLAAGGLPSGSVTSANLALAARQHKIVTASTTNNLSLSGDSGWVSHFSVAFTTTESASTAFVSCHFAQMYESSSVNTECYVGISGATSASSQACQVSAQGWSSNRAIGVQHHTWAFTNLNVGAHTATVYLRNWGGGSTSICSYWDFGSRTPYDYIQVWYI
jgi:hypothetical protein